MARLKAIYFLCILLGAAGALGLDHYCSGAFSGAYTKLQGSLFTGFLTVASFLLSLKAFILLRMRQDVLDTKTYQEHVKAVAGSIADLYRPLKNLSDLLIWTVGASLLCSLSQLTISFIKPPYGSYACAGFAVGAFALVVACWHHLAANIRAWVEAVEREHKSKNP
jgi:hypothetical protein